jgi:hypothetical protein
MPGHKAFRHLPGLPINAVVYVDDFPEEIVLAEGEQLFKIQVAAAMAKGKVGHEVNEVSPQKKRYHFFNHPTSDSDDKPPGFFGYSDAPAVGGNAAHTVSPWPRLPAIRASKEG